MDTLPLDPDDRLDDTALDEPLPRRDWDRAPVLPALGLVLLGVVWLAFLVWPRPPADESVDAGFLRDMMTHHNQAVLMGQITREGTTDPNVAILSLDIAQAQQSQVGEMFGFLEQWGLSPNNDGPAMAWMGEPVEGLMPGMATDDEIARLRTLTGPALDAEFLHLMTLHHLGGLDMATACVELCDDAQVVDIARNITTTQSGEIDLMNEMLVARGQPAVTWDAVMAGMNMGAAALEEAVAPTTGEALRDVLAKTTRSLPVIFGLVALAWLLVDAVRRRRLWPQDLDAPLAPVLAGIGGAAASAALHAGLVPGFLDLRTDLGLFHGAVVVVQAVVAASLIANRRHDLTLVGSVVGLAVIAGWAVLHLVAPDSDDDGRFDLAVTLAIAAEAIQATALFWAWRQSSAVAMEDGPPAAAA